MYRRAIKNLQPGLEHYPEVWIEPRLWHPEEIQSKFYMAIRESAAVDPACGIAAILFFTQEGVFNNLLILAGGVSTLLTLIMRFFGGGGGNGKKD